MSVPPLAGYGRISRVGERDPKRLLSPEQQRDGVLRKGKSMNRDVTWFGIDQDVSGAKASRKVLDQILAAIEAGEVGGMIVSRLDRFSRLKPRERVELLDRIEDAGGELYSAAENIDRTTPEGRFARDVFFGVARMEWERYKEGFDDAKARALDRGVPLGPTPFWLRRLEDGTVDIHPERGPALKYAMAMIGAKRREESEDGLAAAVAYLQGRAFVHDRGKGKRDGKPYTWSTSILRRMVASPVLLGASHYGDTVIRIPALVTRREWELAQADAALPRQAPGEFPLSGLASCRSCGNHMVGGRGGVDARRMYRCAAGLATFKGTRCDEPAAISAKNLEEHVRELLLDALQHSPPLHLVSNGPEEDELVAVEREVLELEAKLDDLTDDTAMRDSIGPERFRRMVGPLAADLDEARGRLSALARAASAAGFGARFPVAEVVARAELHELGPLFAGALDDVRITRGRMALAQRVQVVFKGSETSAVAVTAS